MRGTSNAVRGTRKAVRGTGSAARASAWRRGELLRSVDFSRVRGVFGPKTELLPCELALSDAVLLGELVDWGEVDEGLGLLLGRDRDVQEAFGRL